MGNSCFTQYEYKGIETKLASKNGKNVFLLESYKNKLVMEPIKGKFNNRDYRFTYCELKYYPDIKNGIFIGEFYLGIYPITLFLYRKYPCKYDLYITSYDKKKIEHHGVYISDTPLEFNYSIAKS